MPRASATRSTRSSRISTADRRHPRPSCPLERHRKAGGRMERRESPACLPPRCQRIRKCLVLSMGWNKGEIASRDWCKYSNIDAFDWPEVCMELLTPTRDGMKERIGHLGVQALAASRARASRPSVRPSVVSIAGCQSTPAACHLRASNRRSACLGQFPVAWQPVANDRSSSSRMHLVRKHWATA